MVAEVLRYKMFRLLIYQMHPSHFRQRMLLLSRLYNQQFVLESQFFAHILLILFVILPTTTKIHNDIMVLSNFRCLANDILWYRSLDSANNGWWLQWFHMLNVLKIDKFIVITVLISDFTFYNKNIQIQIYPFSMPNFQFLSFFLLAWLLIKQLKQGNLTRKISQRAPLSGQNSNLLIFSKLFHQKLLTCTLHPNALLRSKT